MSITNESSDRSFRPPVGAILGTVLGVVAWLTFILIYTLYWSKSYDLFQNIIVAVASFLIAGLLIASMWLIWFFSKGGPRSWWNNDDHVAKRGRDNEFLGAGQRFGELVGVFFCLLILAFYVYHQIANTGFYASNFSDWEMFALYGSIVFSTLAPITRAIVGRRNPARLVEAASNIFTTFASLLLLSVFPFNFSHFADALPEAFRFALSWVTNDIAKLALTLVILGTLVSAGVNIVKYATFPHHGRVAGVVTENTQPAYL